MPHLKSAVMCNIQSHVHTVMEFPRVGVVRFYGNNNHGKSVLVKVLSDVVSNAISRPAYRRSIIRRGHAYGEVLMTRYDGMSLLVRIAREASDTYAELTRPEEQPVRRYLADKAIPALVKEFGWHYNGQHGVSLNIHEDKDQFLFVDTRKAVNFDLINGARTDQFAEAAVESLGALLKATKKQRTEFAHCFDVARATYAALQTWDVEEEERIRNECQQLALTLERLNIPAMPLLPSLARAKFYRTVAPMPVIHFPTVYKIFSTPFPEGTKVIHEYVDLKRGVCPVCKRRFVE